MARLEASRGWQRLSQAVLSHENQPTDQAPKPQNVQAAFIDLDDEARTNIATIRAKYPELQSDAEAVRWALMVAARSE